LHFLVESVDSWFFLSFPFLFPAELILWNCGPEGAKNPAEKSPPPDSFPFEDAQFGKIGPACQAKKSRTLVAAMRVSNPDRSSVPTHG
jgi:hypothetical protein